jgi:hypothetical protein
MNLMRLPARIAAPQTIALEVLVCSQCKAPFHFPVGKLSDNAKAITPYMPRLPRWQAPSHTAYCSGV